MEYYSESNPKPIKSMPECKKTVKVFKEAIDKDGQTYLKEVEEINVYKKIQEARNTVELRQLIEKYQPNINMNDLTKLEEITADFTELPENLIEVTNILNNAKQVFEKQPLEIKQAFNNNFNEFLAGSQNGTLKSILNKNKKGELEEKTTKPTEEEIRKAQELLKGVNLNG